RPGMKLVVVDPRRTTSCELADLHLPVRPGTDVWLFNGLLHHLWQRGIVDAGFVDAHTSGLAEALAAAAADGVGEGSSSGDGSGSGSGDGVGSGNVARVARICRVDPAALLAFYELFAATDEVVTAFSQGVNQSSAGTDKANAIINCHLLTGRIGKPGAGPFSLTGQPNAMGGREVGGLANMLAAHLEIEQAVHRRLVQRFWDSPRIAERPGLRAVELFEAIEQGRVKAVWIMATNPVVSLPDADQVRRALAKCELVVVSDVVETTDTTAYAQVLLPALAWGEKDGTVTNSERRISRQRAFLPAPGEARADWRIVCEVATRMGFSGFDYAGPHEIFDEHARLSACGNGLPGECEAPRMFDIGRLAGMTPGGYDALEPVQWPVAVSGAQRLFADGRFAYPDGRARFVPTPPRQPVNAPDERHPLILNTGRVRDHWHTMTRTGRSPTLASHASEPFVDMHPQDALLCGVREGGLARVATRWGAMVGRVRHGGGIARGSVFVPIHWNDQFASDARVGALVNLVVDPVSGEPEFKHTPARVEPFDVAWHGFVLARREPALDGITWWVRIRGAGFCRYELAGRDPIGDRAAWARELLGTDTHDADWMEYEDRSAGIYRAALVVNEGLEACVFVSARPDLPARDWLATLFGRQRIDEIDRVGLLVGQPIGKGADTGPTICSCFGVGRDTICAAIRTHGLRSPADVTAQLKAGGNCGSCLPEIAGLLGEERARAWNRSS
ncbi:MAG TPA: molybdopterin-dependent oxidoreductase, partial [Burkholderiaceae bacterium]|nr:molybdopterin-dependent oxidoreductase [Burkholderiaceae bacterium]